MILSNGIVRVDAAVSWSSLSLKSLDTKLSSKYPITLAQARGRVLRAIKKEREKK